MNYTSLASDRYIFAIAHLAEAFYQTGFFSKIETINWLDPWIEFCDEPSLKTTLKECKQQLNYEYSWNQCCNAIAWLYKYEPQQWRELL